MWRNMMVTRSDHAEECRQYDETCHLDGFAIVSIVATLTQYPRILPATDKDQIAHSNVVETGKYF